MNEEISNPVEVACSTDYTKETGLRWFKHLENIGVASH